MNIQNLLQMGQRIQDQISEIQENLATREITATSGGGMVTAVVDGKGSLRRIAIDPASVDAADVEMLEDLVLAAVAEAQNQARAVYEDEMKRFTGGLPLPIKLPGLL